MIRGSKHFQLLEIFYNHQDREFTMDELKDITGFKVGTIKSALYKWIKKYIIITSNRRPASWRIPPIAKAGFKVNPKQLKSIEWNLNNSRLRE